MDQYEYMTGFLIKEEAKDTNKITGMLNRFGDQGWRFINHMWEVQNGTFYTFERKHEVQ